MSNYVGKFKSLDTFEITGRGTVKCIEFPELGLTYEQVGEWMGKRIKIDGTVYRIKGIETHRPGLDMPCSKAGILIGKEDRFRCPWCSWSGPRTSLITQNGVGLCPACSARGTDSLAQLEDEG